MAEGTKSGEVGAPATYQPRSWVQTDRASHEAWSRLILTNQRAAQLMHVLCAHVGTGNAVVIGQKTLAKLMGCTERTVRNALPALVKGRWLQVVQIGQHGTVNAYRINDRVAWTESRDKLHRLSLFSAQIVADAADQHAETMETTELRRVPLIYPPEEALPAGEGEPGAQIALPGLEPVIEGDTASEPSSVPAAGVVYYHTPAEVMEKLQRMVEEAGAIISAAELSARLARRDTP